MNFDDARKKRSPVWIFLLAAVVMLALVPVGALVAVMMSAPRETVSREMLERQFAGPISALRDLAISYRPARPSEGEGIDPYGAPPRPLPPIASPEWRARLEEAKALFEGREFLGAWVIIEREERSSTYITVKPHALPNFSFKVSGGSPEIDRPALIFWFAGGRYIVEYANLVAGPEGDVRGYGMYVDLDSVKVGGE